MFAIYREGYGFMVGTYLQKEDAEPICNALNFELRDRIRKKFGSRYRQEDIEVEMHKLDLYKIIPCRSEVLS